MTFDYYRNLTPKQRKTYRESNRIAHVELGDPSKLQGAVTALRDALSAGNRSRVKRACVAVARGVCDDLGISRVRVRVGGRRPTDTDGGELLGRCSWDEEETKGALVEVWMRTARRGQVVAFKTLLRTLIHEICHHLDYELHGLDNTFHTEGFFRRESSILRQLVDLPAAPEPEPEPEPDPEPDSEGQLGFDF
ncbi:MAG: hypothetical protein QNL88_14600 [Acidobacteriota bacterium]|nr:hypothetical protein [Acidobacteriota bacterium]